MSDDIISQELSSIIVVETTNLVNKKNEFLSNGLRVRGEYIRGTDMKIPNAQELPQIIENLVTNYRMNILDDVFLNEATLHIGLVTSQPFEDVNHRTANLITNYNLIKQHIAPIIISEEVKETYDQFVYSRDLDSLADLFRTLSLLESQFISIAFSNDLSSNIRHH